MSRIVLREACACGATTEANVPYAEGSESTKHAHEALAAFRRDHQHHDLPKPSRVRIPLAGRRA